MKDCTILLAGFMAEHFIFEDADGHQQDFWTLEEIIKRVTKSYEEELFFRQQLTDFSLELIESPGFWEAVEAVAQALWEHGTLDSAFCKKTIKNAKRKAKRKHESVN